MATKKIIFSPIWPPRFLLACDLPYHQGWLAIIVAARINSPLSMEGFIGKNITIYPNPPIYIPQIASPCQPCFNSHHYRLQVAFAEQVFRFKCHRHRHVTHFSNHVFLYSATAQTDFHKAIFLPDSGGGIINVNTGSSVAIFIESRFPSYTT